MHRPFGAKAIVGGFICVAVAQGCSFFGVKTDAGQDGNAFHSTTTASTTNNPIPLPVEIANDIAKISSGEADGQEKANPTAPPSPTKADLTEPVPQSLNAVAENPAPLSEPLAAVENRAPAHLRKRSRGKTEKYAVKKGDTLMKISFDKFGDVYRWREIYDDNKAAIPNFNAPKVGTILTIHGVEYVVIEKNGKPYLIRRNDTLVKISKGLYGTPAQWRSLWKNNPHLIHNPNKIYAGFTLYYRPPTTGQPQLVNPLTKKAEAPTDRLPAKQE